MKSITEPRRAFWRQILALLPVYLNVFMAGCTKGWAPNAVYFMKKGEEVTATITESAFIISCSEVGRLIAAIPVGFLIDNFGRKKMVTATIILHFIGWSALSINSHLTTLYIARFILGIATSTADVSTIISIGEIGSSKIRGKLTGIYQLSQSSGYLFQIIISIVLDSYFKLSYCTLGMCCINFVFLYWSLETPNYLVSISQNVKALKHLKHIRVGYSEQKIRYEFDKMKDYIEEENKRKTNSNWLEFVLSKKIRMPMIICFLVCFFIPAGGYYSLNSYITIVIPENDFFPKQYYPALVFGSNMLISIALPFYIEIFPRRILLIVGATALSLCLSVLVVTDICYIEYGSETCKWMLTVGVVTVLVLMNGSILPMMNVVKTELLPQSVRGFGGSLCTVSQSIANISIVVTFNFISDNYGLHYNFVLYGVNCLILAFLVYYLLPECRGKFLSEIQEEIGENLEKNERPSKF